MKLIIDIPDKDYEFIKDLQTLVIGSRCSGKTILYNLINAIKNGVPYEERPHGKWIKEDKPWGGFGDRVLVNTCPFCKESFVYHGNNPKFCPECGAEMKEDEV